MAWPTGTGAAALADEAGTPLANALYYVRLLTAEPTWEDLSGLERTLVRLPTDSDEWLHSFLELDGLQGLLDVLSHSLQKASRPRHGGRPLIRTGSMTARCGG